jgi:DNA-binding LacI/PurR family transcriptional regulator
VDIRGLARHLNLSIGTVSRALNGRPGVNPETRRRVLEAASKLNYAPNQSGRSLRKGTTHAIAFLLQPHPDNNQYGEPFFVPLLNGLQAGFAERGLELIAVMDRSGGEQDRLRRIVEARWADAIILAWTRRRDPRIEYLTEVGFPFATLGRSRSGGGRFPSLDLDFAKAAEESVDRLFALGHRRIAMICPSTVLNFAYLMAQGYRKRLRANGIAPDAALAETCEVNEAGGYAATQRVMSAGRPPSAIIYNNEAIALGGCRALRDLGLQPGRDVAVLVVVAGPFCRYMSPALTGFSVPLEALGRRLSEILLASIPQYAGEDGPKPIREVWPLEWLPGETDLPFRLVPVGKQV